MSDSWGCFKTAAVGCVVLTVLAIAIPIAVALLIMRPFNRAIDTRAGLEASFGAQEAYVPPPSGAPDADRIAVFLEVRQALAATCEEFAEKEQQVARLEAFDDRPEVSRIEVLRQAASTTRSMLGMGPLIGRFFELRNQALAEGGMGLGEYSYIYVLAYNAEMLDPGESTRLLGEHATNSRVRRALRAMLANQLAAIDDGAAEAQAELAAELARLDADAERIPWQDGLPAALDEALLPHREALRKAFCPATAPLELMINVKRGPAVETL
jgi:hypothetical protein